MWNVSKYLQNFADTFFVDTINNFNQMRVN